MWCILEEEIWKNALGAGTRAYLQCFRISEGAGAPVAIVQNPGSVPHNPDSTPISVTPLAGDLKPSSDLYRYQSHTCMYIHMHSEKTFILIKIHMFKKFLRYLCV